MRIMLLEWILFALFLFNTATVTYILFKLSDMQVDIDMLVEMTANYINKKNKKK